MQQMIITALLVVALMAAVLAAIDPTSHDATLIANGPTGTTR